VSWRDKILRRREKKKRESRGMEDRTRVVELKERKRGVELKQRKRRVELVTDH
jgi:hypothetical protein